MKRSARIAAVLIVLGLPVLAGAQSEESAGEDPAATPQVAAVRNERKPRSCKVIAKQIARYEGVVVMAQERGDERWEEGTRAHIARLTAQQQRRCPQDPGPSNAEQAARLLRLAAVGFMKAMTFGAF